MDKIRKYDVFFYEAFKEEQEALKKYLPNNIKAGFTHHCIQETDHDHALANIISIRTQSRIPDQILSNIEALLTRSTGYDHILNFRKQINNNFKAGYLPLYCSRAVAEHACLLWLCLLRKLKRQIEQFEIFKRDNITGFESLNKTITIVGVGNIGYEIACIAKGLKMNVVGVDIEKKHNDINYKNIEEALGMSDIVVCAMSLNNNNENYFNINVFNMFKDNAVFINIARGELVKIDDLMAALRSGKLGGIGSDVYPDESQMATYLRENDQKETDQIRSIIELSKNDNVIFTPHNAFNTFESVERKSEKSIMQINKFISDQEFLWEVPDR